MRHNPFAWTDDRITGPVYVSIDLGAKMSEHEWRDVPTETGTYWVCESGKVVRILEVIKFNHVDGAPAWMYYRWNEHEGEALLPILNVKFYGPLTPPEPPK